MKKKATKKVPKAPEFLHFRREDVEGVADYVGSDGYVEPQGLLDNCGCDGECDCGCPVAVYKFVGYGTIERPPAALVMDK